MNTQIVIIAIVLILIVLVVVVFKQKEKFQQESVEYAIIEYFNKHTSHKFTDYLAVVSKFPYPNLRNVGFYTHFVTRLPLAYDIFDNIDINTHFKNQVIR